MADPDPSGYTPGVEDIIRPRGAGVAKVYRKAIDGGLFTQQLVAGDVAQVAATMAAEPERQQWALATLPRDFVNTLARNLAQTITMQPETVRLISHRTFMCDLAGRLDEWEDWRPAGDFLQDYVDLLVSEAFMNRPV